jgi:hypothetical protein
MLTIKQVVEGQVVCYYGHKYIFQICLTSKYISTTKELGQKAFLLHPTNKLTNQGLNTTAHHK